MRPHATSGHEPSPGNAWSTASCALLRTPLLHRAVGSRLITIYVVGRKTGHRYTLPVAYLRQGDALLIGSPFSWIRNLRTGVQVDIRYPGAANRRGRRRHR